MDREFQGQSAGSEPRHEGSSRAARLASFAAARPRITTYLEPWHDTQGFRCVPQPGAVDQQYVEIVQAYLRDDALRDSDAGNGQTYVYCDPDRPERVYGFYHLSASKVHSSEISAEQLDGLDSGPISVFAITWLGKSADAVGKLGNVLIVDAALRAAEMRGARGLVLTAATSNLIPYYQRNNFRLCAAAQKKQARGGFDTNFLMYADLATILGA